MKTLRIKCPSCGVILEVRNSKDEAVKRITCPNCKKQLAVTFADAPKSDSSVNVGALYEGEVRYQLQEGVNALPHTPSGVAELKAVRLASGAYKHILRVLTDDECVVVNGQPLHQDDEVVLLRGDELKVGHILLTFDKPGKAAPAKEPDDEPIKESPNPPVRKSSKPWVLLVIVVGLACGAIWWYFASHHTPKHPAAKLTDTVLVAHDTVRPKKTSEPTESAKTSKAVKKEDKQSESHPAIDRSTDDYSLETLAIKGNVNAQYQLGMRWVTSNDCSEVIKGVKYLESAARSGSANAQYALGIVYHKGSPACGIHRNPALSRQYMQMAANNGLEKAKRFLESNQDE